MIPIEQQVCSFEIAKKLKELRVEQNAINTWIKHPEYPEAQLLRAPYEFFGPCDVDGTGRKYYSAFSASESYAILRGMHEKIILITEDTDNIADYFASAIILRLS